MLSLVLAAALAPFAPPPPPEPRFTIPRGTVPAAVTPDPRPPVRPQ